MKTKIIEERLPEVGEMKTAEEMLSPLEWLKEMYNDQFVHANLDSFSKMILDYVEYASQFRQEVSEPRNEQLTCPHTYHTKRGYCKYCGLYCGLYNADKNIL